MEIKIHNRALVALDYLEPGERDAVHHALEALVADASGARSRPKRLPSVEGGEYYLLPVPHGLRLILQKITDSPPTFEVSEVMRLETIQSYIEHDHAA